MRTFLLAAGLAVALTTPRLASQPQGAADVPAPGGQTAPASQVERGRYLVHHVAMCVQCHSPRDRHGVLQQDRLLRGASVPVESPFLGPRWAFNAPNIVRAPGYDRNAFVRLLTTGIANQGQPPRAPMPPFRMTRDDAEAVWEYLRSL